MYKNQLARVPILPKHRMSKVLNLGDQGFIQGPWNSPPLSYNFLYPEILKLSMVIILAIYMLLNVSMCHQNVVWKFCPRLHQKQSERM